MMSRPGGGCQAGSRTSAIPENAEHRRPDSTAAVRLVDVARVARVSPITVSRALREPHKVSPQTRARVAAAVEQTGYVPDLVASSLTRREHAARGRRRAYDDCVDLRGHRCRRHGDPARARLRGADRRQRIRARRRGEADRGLPGPPRRRHRASNVAHTDNARRLLQRARVPVVETGNLTGDPIDMVVGFSNADAARDMLAHLVARGHRTIGFIGAPRAGNPQAADRRRAYDAAVKKHRLARAPSLAVECASDVAAGGDALDRIVDAASGRQRDFRCKRSACDRCAPAVPTARHRRAEAHRDRWLQRCAARRAPRPGADDDSGPAARNRASRRADDRGSPRWPHTAVQRSSTSATRWPFARAHEAPPRSSAGC